MKGWKLPTRDKARAAAIKQFGDKKLAVITGASTPLGEKTIQELLKTGDYHVIGAYAKEAEFANKEQQDNFTPLVCDPTRLDSVRNFCDRVHEFRGSKTLDRLVCSITSSYEDTATPDGFGSIAQVNFLSNYLVTCQLLDGMVDSMDASVITVGNNKDVSMDLADLSNVAEVMKGTTNNDKKKAQADAVLCQKLVTNYLHTKYHKLTGVNFHQVDDSSVDIASKICLEGAPISGTSLLLNQDAKITEDVNHNKKSLDIDAAVSLFDQCNQLLGDIEWPAIKQITSPCPTLKVIGAITKGSVKREELKRMAQGRPGISEPIPLKKSKRQRVAAFCDKCVTFTLSQTVGRVKRFAGKRILGKVPEKALQGSYSEALVGDDVVVVSDDDIVEIQREVSNQLLREKKGTTKFGNKKLVVMTGTSSGLGRKAALALLRTGDYHVIGAVRDMDKMEAVAEVDGFDMENFTPLYCEMNSFESIKEFCQKVDEFRGSKPLDRLVCNAGIYQPSLPYAKWSKDGHEQTMQTNFLSHFLMISKLMTSMEGSDDPRVTMVGSVTGNDNTVGGGGVYPIADLHDLDGFQAGFDKPIEMADGYGFDGAKAYKDSKLCLMMLANFLHTKYHKATGIAFSSMYPGCIAESPLFREKRPWFRKYFPIFMKFITGGFVGEHEAGQRLFQVVHDPRCTKSGVYWSWNGGPREGRGAEAIEKGGQISGGGGAGGGWDSIFENDQSSKVLNLDTAYTLFTTATKITGATWPYEQSEHYELAKKLEITTPKVVEVEMEMDDASVATAQS